MAKKVVLYMSVLLLLMGIAVRANTGENVSSGDLLTGSALSISKLYSYLNLQKQNIDTLLLHQQEQLLKMKNEIIAGLSEYEIIECLQTGGIDRSIPIETIQKASVEDYITLNNKIQTLDLKQKAGISGVEADAEVLMMQITTYAETYQKTVNQAVQKTLDRFTAQKQTIQNYLTQHASTLQQIKNNKHRIEQVLHTFDALQKFLYNSRLTYGLVLQEFVNARSVIKQKLLTTFGELLSKEIAKATKKYSKYIGFHEALQAEKNLAMLLRGAKYDMWRDSSIGKYVDDRVLSMLSSLVETLRGIYYVGGKPKCELMKTLGKKEEEMLTTIQKQLELFTKDMQNITSATGNSEVDYHAAKKQFASMVEGFYKTLSKEEVDNFKKSVKKLKKEFDSKVSKDLEELQEINAMNEQFWTVEKVADQEKIAQEMIPRCKHLAKKTIHIGIKNRCERIIQAATERLYVKNSNEQQEQNQQTEEANTQTQRVNTEANTNSSPQSPHSQPTLSDSEIVSKVKEQLDKIAARYPDQKVRRAAMMVLVNNINAKLASGNVSQDEIKLYQALKAALEKEIEKMKTGQ